MFFKRIRKELKQALTVALTATMIASMLPVSLLPATAAGVKSVTATEAITEEATTQEVTTEEATTEEVTTQEQTTEEATTEATSEDTTEVTTEEATTEETEKPADKIVSTMAAGTQNKALRAKVDSSNIPADGNIIMENITAENNTPSVSSNDIVSYDIYIPADSNFEGSLYVKPVVKMGSGWTWLDNGDAGVSLTNSSFKACSESGKLRKYSFSGEIGKGAGDYTGQVMQCVEAVIYTDTLKNFNSYMYIDNVKVTDKDSVVKFHQNYDSLTDAVLLGEGIVGKENKVIYKNDFNAETGDTYTKLADGNMAMKFSISKSVSENSWGDIINTNFTLEKPYNENIQKKANLSYDILLPSDADFTGSLKGQAAFKRDSNDYIKQKSWPEYHLADFTTTDAPTGYKKIHVSIDMDDLARYDSITNSDVPIGLDDIYPITDVIPTIAGYYCSYLGDIYLDNVVFTDISEEVGEQKPIDGDLFLSLDPANWTAEGATDNWQYTKKVEVSGLNLANSTLLELGLDYTDDSSFNWSEAKTDYLHATSIASMSGYDCFKMDFYYKDSNRKKGGFTCKIFADKKTGIDIDKYVNVGEGTEVTDIPELSGYKKAEVTISFDDQDKAFQKLTLGIIGISTDYKGKVYVGNARFSQAADIYVNSSVSPRTDKKGITVEADTIKTASGDTALDKDVTLADPSADTIALQTYSYLKAVGESDSVIFGHQNDTHKKAGHAADDTFSTSDVKDLTGSYSGVVGLDTLSLTGDENSTWDATQADRVSALAAITNNAADQGSIITLSAHMPNFSLINEKVAAQKSGTEATDSATTGYWGEGETITYNFSGYSPTDTSGDVVSRIMPGQDLNYLYTAYLDMIASYANAVKDHTTILFRPFHEGSGSWFWWGAAYCTPLQYQELYRYTEDYLQSKGVHNMLYVYSPGSEPASLEEYGERYPGDAYVDIVGYDIYHDHPTQENETAFLNNILTKNQVVNDFASLHNKLFALTETGMKDTYSDASCACKKSGNEVKDWYNQLFDVLKDEKGLSYFMVWANFNDSDNFYVPYAVKKNDNGTWHGHEMMDQFISFYNEDQAIFASEMLNNSIPGLKSIQGVINSAQAKSTVSGYIVAPKTKAYLQANALLKATVSGTIGEGQAVQFVLEGKTGESALKATKVGDMYQATITQDMLDAIGTGAGILRLELKSTDNTVVLNKINVYYNMEEPVKDPLVVDNFETYEGNTTLLTNAWSSNVEASTNGSFKLTNDSLFTYSDSLYALEMGITFNTDGGYAGATKNVDADWSSANALEFYTVPVGDKHKVVVQITSNKKVFEVYLNEVEAYVDTNISGIEQMKVTIPFSQFKARDSKTDVFDASKINSVGLFCNEIAGNTLPDQVTLYYDEIKAVSTAETDITVTSTGKACADGWSVSCNDTSLVYTGKALTPAVDVTDGRTTLKLNKDYTIRFKNNINVGTASYVVTGRGNYSKCKSEGSFSIVEKQIDDESISVKIPTSVAYNKGKKLNVSISVKDGNRTLSSHKNKDYSVDITYGDEAVKQFDKAGAYKVTINGHGNYTGNKSFTVTVTDKKFLNKLRLTIPSSIAYDTEKEEQELSTEKIVLKDGRNSISLESGFEISYKNNSKIGTATVTITALDTNENYTGSISKNFRITGIAFNTGKVTIEGFDSSMTYTGKTLTQSVTLKDHKTKEVIPADKYQITYLKNTNAGTATMMITGQDEYTGVIRKTFRIMQEDIKNTVIGGSGIQVTYSKKGNKPDMSVYFNQTKLVLGKDYTLSYTNNSKATTSEKPAYMTITGKGNFKGRLNKVKSFKILPKSLSNADISSVISDVKYNAKAKDNYCYKSGIRVYDGTSSISSGDYTVTYTGNTQADIGTFDQTNGYSVNVVVTAKNNKNYKGSFTTSFRVTGNLLSSVSAKITQKQFMYDQNGVTLSADDLEVKLKGTTLVYGTDYTIVGYKNNFKVGTAKVVLKGLGSYGGTKEVSFRISGYDNQK